MRDFWSQSKSFMCERGVTPLFASKEEGEQNLENLLLARVERDVENQSEEWRSKGGETEVWRGKVEE